MPGRRDRHGRGLRGPLALPGPLTRHPARPPHPGSKVEVFHAAVHEAVDRIADQCPEALVGVTFGVEDVPALDGAWTDERVPLAAAVEADAQQMARVVVYRRPIEHRAASRRGLRILVYRTVVEQLAAVTGRSVAEIDPLGDADDD